MNFCNSFVARGREFDVSPLRGPHTIANTCDAMSTEPPSGGGGGTLLFL